MPLSRRRPFEGTTDQESMVSFGASLPTYCGESAELRGSFSSRRAAGDAGGSCISSGLDSSPSAEPTLVIMLVELPGILFGTLAMNRASALSQHTGWAALPLASERILTICYAEGVVDDEKGGEIREVLLAEVI